MQLSAMQNVTQINDVTLLLLPSDVQKDAFIAFDRLRMRSPIAYFWNLFSYLRI